MNDEHNQEGITPRDIPDWMLESVKPLDEATAKRFGFAPLSANEIEQATGVPPQGVNGYGIPFSDPVTGAPYACPDGRPFVHIRLRKEIAGKEGFPTKFLSPKGGGTHLYVLPEVHKHLVEHPDAPIIVTEGEKKAIYATLAGFPCVGLTGPYGWAESRLKTIPGAYGAPAPAGVALHHELVQYLTRGRQVIAIWDSDVKTKPEIGKRFAPASSYFGRLLGEYGCPYAEVVLPHTDDQTKTGLDDYLSAGHSVDELRSYIEASKKPVQLLKTMTAVEVVTATYPEPKWAVPGILSEGLTILGGKPKVGKSWLALQICHAIASGGKVLGDITVRQGPVLYLALEDTPRRLKDRLLAIDPHEAGHPAALHILTDLPSPGFETLLQSLGAWLGSNPDCRLVCIDTLGRIKPPSRKNGQAYEEDTRFMAPLQDLAKRHSVAVLVVHHTRKQESDDMIDSFLGSTALAGVADTGIVLKRSRLNSGGELHVRGRDVEEMQLALSFSDGVWTILGDARDVLISQERKAIIDLLRKSETAMTPTQIADALGMKRNNVQKLLARMVADGYLRTDGKGHYTVVPDTAHTDPEPDDTPPPSGGPGNGPGEGAGPGQKSPDLFDRLEESLATGIPLDDNVLLCHPTGDPAGDTVPMSPPDSQSTPNTPTTTGLVQVENSGHLCHPGHSCHSGHPCHPAEDSAGDNELVFQEDPLPHQNSILKPDDDGLEPGENSSHPYRSDHSCHSCHPCHSEAEVESSDMGDIAPSGDVTAEDDPFQAQKDHPVTSVTSVTSPTVTAASAAPSIWDEIEEVG